MAAISGYSPIGMSGSVKRNEMADVGFVCGMFKKFFPNNEKGLEIYRTAILNAIDGQVVFHVGHRIERFPVCEDLIRMWNHIDQVKDLSKDCEANAVEIKQKIAWVVETLHTTIWENILAAAPKEESKKA